MKTMPAKPEWLRANFHSQLSGVDKEKRRINGMVVAMEGDFKTGRGSFDLQSLETIEQLMQGQSAGLKSRLSHATLSDDGVSKYLGRIVNGRLGKAIAHRDGVDVEVNAIRGDLVLSDSAFEGNPNGNIGQYVLDLAADDPGALSSSLVLQTDQEPRRDAHGQLAVDDKGNTLPPLWRPKKLHGADIVGVGDAVDDLLSVYMDIDELPDMAVRRGAELLDSVFAGQPREAVQARLEAYIDRYLSRRYGQPVVQRGGCADVLRRRLELRAKA